MKEFFTNPNNHKRLVVFGITAVVVVAALAAALFLFLRGGQDNPDPLNLESLMRSRFVVYASDEGPAGLGTDAHFIIETAEAFKTDELEEMLSVTPSFEYDLVRENSKKFLLQPKETLDPNAVYNVLISTDEYAPPLSWAFQTKNFFAVSSVLPADNASQVPLDTGIEIRFSQPIDISAGDSFTIIPNVQGRFVVDMENILIFMPSERLTPETEYAVRLDAGTLASQAGDSLETDYVFAFSTAPIYKTQDSAYLYAYDGIWDNRTSTETIYVAFNADRAFKDVVFKSSLYKFPNSESYLSVKKSMPLDGYKDVDTQGFNKIYDVSATLTFSDEESYYYLPSFFELPANPGVGYYLLDIWTESPDDDLNGRHLQRFIQISDISLYNMNTGDKALFWLNNALTGEPIQNAEITFDNASGKSSIDGMAILQHPGKDAGTADEDSGQRYEERFKALRITADGMEYADYIYWQPDYVVPLSMKYYSYVYTDREMYQPTDKVHFWGMVIPRGAASERPTEIYLDWKDGGQYPDGLTIQLAPNGSFSGEIDLEKHVSGWHSLSFMLNDEYLTSKGFSIMEYEKPVYTVSRKVDKDYYRKDDKMRLQLEGGFFDGSPAEGLTFSVEMGGSVENQAVEVRLDRNGQAEAVFTVGGGASWRPYSTSVYYHTTSAESRIISGYQSVLIFPSNYILKANAQRTKNIDTDADTNEGDENSIIELTLDGYSMDFSAISKDSYAYMMDDYKALEGARAEFEGTATLIETEYTKIKSGDYYDYKNKRVVETYRYESLEHKRDEIAVSTVNGRLVIEFQGYPDVENKQYRVEIQCRAPDGSRLEETAYVYSGSFRYYDHYRRGDFYSFRINEHIDADYNAYTDDGYMINSYGIGEEVSIELVDDDRQKPEKGRMIYIVLGTDLFVSQVSSTNNFEANFTFLSKYAPNITILGAYFDGQYIYKVYACDLRYRYNDSEISLNVKPGKTSYLPGEEFSADIDIYDVNGHGLSADYLISIADEAAFAVAEQVARPLQSIYRMVYLNYAEYVSYIPFNADGVGAEKGDGGADDAVRSKFVDTAAFIKGKTDANGHGQITVKLPDNMTSWRITSIAFAEQTVSGVNIPKVGNSVVKVAASLPFFINAVLNSRYIEGDSVGLTLRSGGSAIDSNSETSYELTLSGEGVNLSKSANGKAGDFLSVDFGLLKQGAYKLLIRGKSGSFSDAVELNVSVVDSLLNFRRQITGDLVEGIDVKPTRFPVEITFYDIENELFYDVLYRLLNPQGKRADQVLTNALARKRLIDEEGEGSAYLADNEDTEPDVNESVQWRYGVRLLPYARTDVLLTAKLALTSLEYLDRDSLIDYFTDVLNREDAVADDVAAAYMGLGVLKAPVLLTLRKLLQDDETFDFRQRLLLAVGLAAIGDRDSALSWYEGCFGESPLPERAADRRSVKAIQDGKYRYINIDGSLDYHKTAEIAMLTAVIGHSDATGYMAYLLDFDYYNYDPLPELAVWISLYSPRPTQSAFSYYDDGDKSSKTLDFTDKRMHTLIFGETQLAAAAFNVDKGRVGYQISYTASLIDEGPEAPPLAGVSIHRSLDKDVVKLGEELKVTTVINFDDQAVVGYYIINAVLPSGFRLVGVNEREMAHPFYYDIGESGNLRYYIPPVYPDGSVWYWSNEYKDPALRSMPDQISITYTARAVLPGDYTIEADTYAAEWSSYLYKTERSQVKVIP